MENNRWIVVYEKYCGLQKHALNLINQTVFDFYKDYISFYCAEDVVNELLKDNNLIIVGTKNNKIISDLLLKNELEQPNSEQGYSIVIKDSPFNNDKQIIAICGEDERGVLYGSVDFINQYCGYLVYRNGKGDMEHASYFSSPFVEKIPEWKVVSSPSVLRRGIWTWGHCIYDYKAFFNNMVMLKLNEVVIWNDYAPINANEVVEYAHSLGIKVVWGFAWGWGVNCNVSMGMDDQSLQQLKASIIEKYENEYKNILGDGIYFQSCTELSKEYINGKLIAETVVNLVNDTASELLNRYPNLHIQFGLHSNSVKNRLEYIAKVDSRITIVWENCGAFPFFSSTLDHHNEQDFEEVEDTVGFTKQISTLRDADDQFGMVLKGICSLDWSDFHHQQPNLILGEKSKIFIENRTKQKHQILKLRQAIWVRHADYMQKIVKGIVDKRGGNICVQSLVEDGMFESEIPLSSAIYAEILWDCKKESQDVVCEVLKYPCVICANL